MAKMVLATFAETKVARLPGRNPARLQLGILNILLEKIYLWGKGIKMDTRLQPRV